MAKRPKELILYCEQEMRKVYGFKLSASSFNILKPAYQRQYTELRGLPRKTLRKIISNGLMWITCYIAEIEESGDTAKTFEDITAGYAWVDKGKSLVQKMIVAAEILIGEGCASDYLPDEVKMIEARRRVWIKNTVRYWFKDFSKACEEFIKKTDALYLELDKIRRADPVYQEAERQRRALDKAAAKLYAMSEKELREYESQQDKVKIQQLEVRFTELSGREPSYSQVRSHMGDPDLFNPDDLVSSSALLACWREVLTDLEYKVKYKGWLPLPKLE